MKPLTQVTRVTKDTSVRFPTAHEASLRGELAPTLIRSDHCNQTESCAFFEEILVIVHLNPQRLEWMEPLLDYALHFVPNVMITTLPDTRNPANNVSLTADEARAYRNHLILGDKNRYVHLMDAGIMGTTGDHNDVVNAMRMYPNFRGYLYWAQEDVLPGFWNFVNLDKDKPWFQPIQELFSFQSRTPMCSSYSKKWRGKRRKKGRGYCTGGMIAKDARDWRKIYGALGKIRNDSQADYDQIKAGAGLGLNLYYVPINMFPKFERYSAYMYEAEGYVEFATGALLHASFNEGQQKEELRGINIWPDSHAGRFNPVAEFRWPYHFTHPIRITSDILVRLRDLARETQVASVANTTSEAALWEVCYTCEEYSNNGSFLHSRKGRYHSCAKGCGANSSLAEPTSPRGGRVFISKTGTVPEGEMVHEGFWNIKSSVEIYARMLADNKTAVPSVA